MIPPSEAAVLAANRGFYAAFSGRDQAALARLWARAHPVVCVHPGWEVIHGRDAVLASFRAILKAPDSPKVEPSDEVAVVLGEAAMVTCVENIGDGRLVATNVFVFESGAWRMVHHHASPTAGIRPPSGPPASELN